MISLFLRAIRRLDWAAVLIWGLPLLLAVPAVGLAVLGHMPLWAALAQVLLPTGILTCLLGSGSRTGLRALCLLPLMALAAFQIVLLFLYGDGSIIGVDMFLNVVTTNPAEAGELLGNILPSILLAVGIYLPAIAAAIVLMVKGMTAPPRMRQDACLFGVTLSVAGAICLSLANAELPHYRVDEDLYPVNVVSNLASAVGRVYDLHTYPEESAHYRYYASSMRSPSTPEVYIAVIGETSRADNWQVYDYPRFTSPRMAQLSANELVAFPHAMSESNTTHKAVPMLLSPVTAETFADSINSMKSVITAFKEAGFHTSYVSMQGRNGSYIDFFGQEADSVVFLHDGKAPKQIAQLHDEDCLPVVDGLLQRGGKQLIVVHLYGSHFNYADRYDRQRAYFLPDLAAKPSRATRGRLINAYDNSIRQTDLVLHHLMARLDQLGIPGALIFTSDHGEDIFDDERGRFLHASPSTSYQQLHVPLLVHINPQLQRLAPELQSAAEANRKAAVSSSRSFAPTLVSLAGIRTGALPESLALTSPLYRAPRKHLFLNDLNRAESLAAAGFNARDFAQLAQSCQIVSR